jgi:hypothetical protein
MAGSVPLLVSVKSQSRNAAVSHTHTDAPWCTHHRFRLLIAAQADHFSKASEDDEMRQAWAAGKDVCFHEKQ